MLSGPPPSPLIWTYLLGLKESIWTIQVLSYQIRNRREKTKSQRTEKTCRKFMREARWCMCRGHFSSLPVRMGRSRKWEEGEYGLLCTFCPFRSDIRDETEWLIQYTEVHMEHLGLGNFLSTYYALRTVVMISMIHSNYGWRCLDTGLVNGWDHTASKWQSQASILDSDSWASALNYYRAEGLITHVAVWIKD